MKIIQLYVPDEVLVKKALHNDSKAEETLYTRYAPKMLGVCRCYVKDMHYAEDIMIQGFTKAFENLGKFRFEGSFEGWLRRIMVREAIDFLRSRRQLQFADIDTAADVITATEPEIEYDADVLQLLIDGLPTGYKTVLVLFAIEGYSHKEIAEMLSIKENTSKSQVFKARRMLQQQLEALNKKRNGKI